MYDPKKDPAFQNNQYLTDYGSDIQVTSMDPCNTPNPPWFCEDHQPIPIHPNILTIVIMFMFGIALIAQSVRASDS